MSVLASIIILILSVVKNPCDAVRPVVTFTHWKIIYEGDTVTTSCDMECTAQYSFYFWYKNTTNMEKYVQKYTIISAEEKDGGDYVCWASGLESLPARLHVLSKGSAERPVVTFTPNWRKIFVGERVNITCDTGSTARGNQQYYWYKDKQVILYEEKQRDITITSAALEHSGEYQCRAGSGDVSFPVRLEVSSGSLILQAPPNVYEGDTLTLRCHSRSLYYNEKETVFHIGSTDIQSQQPRLDIPNVNTTMTGIYGCTRKVGGDNRTDETFISIQALFDTPQITYWSLVTEGYAMTLTCYTKRNPARSGMELHFAFYRDGQNVQEFSASATHNVLAVQLMHSGNYTCDVRTPSGSVRKRSDAFHIQIQELFSYPEIKLVPTDIITEGASMTLTCNTVIKIGYSLQHQFAFYRDGRTVQDFSASTTYSVPSAQPVHSGKYTCEVRDPTGGVRKRSEVLSIQIKDVSIHHSLQNAIRLSLSACVLVILSCILFCHIWKQQNNSVTFRCLSWKLRMSTDDVTVPA